MNEIKDHSIPHVQSVADEGDGSDHNPNATARRRLLRALGGSGAALSAVLAGSWQKPVIDSVLLPAHAQTTEGVDTSVPAVAGCVLTLAYTFQPSTGTITPGPNPMGQLQTYHLVAGDWFGGPDYVNERTIATTTHVGSQPISLTGTAVMAEGAEAIGLGHRRTMVPAPANVHATAFIECCNGDATGAIDNHHDAQSTAEASDAAAYVEVTDGTCTFFV